MCGIAGIVDYRNRLGASELTEVVTAMTDTLTHRGPDSGGVWTDPATGVGLGHRRLAIRDLSPTGYQPMHSAGDRFVLVYNGEVYSHREMAAELTALGSAFKGTSDTEIILEGFAQWGVAATLERMIGMFAIALYDKETRRLYLMRDRLGIKPVYWGLFDSCLVFGSELKALRRADCWEPRLNRDALASFMRHNYIPAPLTIYQGVHKLEPGTFLAIGPDREPSITRYWDLRAKALEGLARPDRRPEAEQLEELDLLLRDAVSRRMVSDVPLGALLSGGIDSSLVTAIMAEEHPETIDTFSIGFRESQYNEAHYAKEIARHLGTRHTELYVEPGHALDLVDSLPHWYDEPFADSSQIPTALVCELTKQYVTVVQSGDGGDENFAGYTRYVLGLEAAAKTAKLPPAARRALVRAIGLMPEQGWRLVDACLPNRRGGSSLSCRMQKLAEGLSGPDFSCIYRQMLTHWHEPEALVPGASEFKGVIWEDLAVKDFPNPLDYMQFLDSVTYLCDDILTKVDRASMRVALECRVPLLDHRVVELAWRMPREMKMRGDETKWALRQLLYRRVPRELIDRPKMGFGVPIDLWLRGPLLQWAEELLDPGRLKRQGLFDPEPIRGYWKAHKAGENWAYPLWDVLMAQTWLDANPGVTW